jgi:hypothetical protein
MWRRLLSVLPFVLLGVAAGVGAWVGWDAWQATREANQTGAAGGVAAPATTTTVTLATTTSSSTTTTTMVPASSLDGIVLYRVDDCPRCDWLETRLGELAAGVPLWVRPAEGGMWQLPVIVVQYGGEVTGRWEGQVAVNSAEAIADWASQRWDQWTTPTVTEAASACPSKGLLWGGDYPARNGVLTEGIYITYRGDFSGFQFAAVYLGAHQETVLGFEDVWVIDLALGDNPIDPTDENLTVLHLAVGRDDWMVFHVEYAHQYLGFGANTDAADYDIWTLSAGELVQKLQPCVQYSFEFWERRLASWNNHYDCDQREACRFMRAAMPDNALIAEVIRGNTAGPVDVVGYVDVITSPHGYLDN